MSFDIRWPDVDLVTKITNCASHKLMSIILLAKLSRIKYVRVDSSQVFPFNTNVKTPRPLLAKLIADCADQLSESREKNNR